ncbi:STAS domain-containing protein [Nocardioides dilutus]
MTRGGVARSGAGRVDVARHPGVDVVTVTGDLDVHHHRALQSAISDATQVAQTEVVLDLTQVAFLDSAGIGALLQCRRALAGRAAHLSLVCAEGGRVHRLLEASGLDGELPTYPTTQAALDALVVGG